MKYHSCYPSIFSKLLQVSYFLFVWQVAQDKYACFLKKKRLKTLLQAQLKALQSP